MRRRCVLEGFELALCGRQRSHPPVPKLLNGEQEAQVIDWRLGAPPAGRGCWRGRWSNWGSWTRSVTRP